MYHKSWEVSGYFAECLFLVQIDYVNVIWQDRAKRMKNTHRAYLFHDCVDKTYSKLWFDEHWRMLKLSRNLANLWTEIYLFTQKYLIKEEMSIEVYPFDKLCLTLSTPCFYSVCVRAQVPILMSAHGPFLWRMNAGDCTASACFPSSSISTDLTLCWRKIIPTEGRTLQVQNN